VSDLPAENRKRANHPSISSPLQLTKKFPRVEFITHSKGVYAMSISTKRGDAGQTGLAGDIRVSKSNARVEAYGTVDELNASLGLARSICENKELRDATAAIQRELFRVGSALATPAASAKPQVPVTPEMVDALTNQVHQIEAIEGVLSDWSISGEHTAAAAYDVARTICRRAERNVVRLVESGEVVDANVLAYLNRLSDLIWLFGRKLEFDAGVSGSLRAGTGKAGAKWSRAW
jgi:cob(I)alamin adenosyltransferase